MNPRVVIFALLVGAFVLGDLASAGYISQANSRWPDLPGLILLAAVFGQATMVAVWFTFTRWNIVLRLLTVLATVLGLAMTASAATGGPAATTWYAMLVIAFCSLSIPLAAAKLLRWRIGWEGETYSAMQSRLWQFSLWGLLSTTTAVAIALGTAQSLDMPVVEVRGAIAFFSCIVMTGLVVFAVSMGIRHPAAAAMITLPVVFLFCPLAGILIGRTGLPPEEHPVRWAVFGFCDGAIIAVSVLALRIAGFRMTREPLLPQTDKIALDQDAGHQREAQVDAKRVIELPRDRSAPSDTAPRPRLTIHPHSDDG